MQLTSRPRSSVQREAGCSRYDRTGARSLAGSLNSDRRQTGPKQRRSLIAGWPSLPTRSLDCNGEHFSRRDPLRRAALPLRAPRHRDPAAAIGRGFRSRRPVAITRIQVRSARTLRRIPSFPFELAFLTRTSARQSGRKRWILPICRPTCAAVAKCEPPLPEKKDKSGIATWPNHPRAAAECRFQSCTVA